jgi:hypothetical protein
VNWFRLLADLQSIGWDNAAVAKHLDVPRTTLRQWKAGCEPRYCDGARLVGFWASQLQRGLDGLPMSDPYDWRT